jgi:formylglycine-generating enzyme required for sulfatase activity
VNWSKNGYRLPTEAEWEYACRAGETSAFNNGNDDCTNATLVGAIAWFNGNSGSKTHQVGLKSANKWGLYDMHGNVHEWCWDWYEEYTTEAQTDPTGAVTGTSRIMRGGRWNQGGSMMRSAYRYSFAPSVRDPYIGFRLVRGL